MSKQQFGENDLQTADCLHNRAAIYANQGNYSNAIACMQQVLTIRENVLEMDHPQIANSLCELAKFVQTQGDTEQAKVLYQRAFIVDPFVKSKKAMLERYAF